MPNIPDIYKLLGLYFIDSIDCIPGPCPDFKYQSVDKLIDFFTYVCILVYIWPRTQPWFLWLLVGSLLFRLVGLWFFYKSRDDSVLIKFPDYFRELTIVNLLFPGNVWWILAVFIFKPFVEVYLHAKKTK